MLRLNKWSCSPSPGNSRGLYLFLAGLVGLPDRNQVSNYSINGGMVYQGLFPGRPHDDLGFAISQTHYTGHLLNTAYAQRLGEGGAERPAPNLVMLELHYALQVSPWLNVMPNFQYIINPDGFGGSLAYPPLICRTRRCSASSSSSTCRSCSGFRARPDASRSGLIIRFP